MNELVLYDKYGVALFTIDLDESSMHDWSLMGENKLSISFEREKCAVLTPGCYVEFDGMRYYLLDEYKPRMINSVTWKYDVAFLDAASWMSVVLAMNTIDGKKLPIFNYTGPAREHAEIIVANLNRYMGTAEWKVGTVIDTPNIHIEYRGKYCAQILQEIVDSEDTEWWVDGMTLNIGRAEFGDAVELGYRKGLLGDISREQAADKRAYAYLVPIGSTRNIDPTKYGYERLQLPNGQVFVDINPDGVGELIEERAFAEIYPRYEGTVQYVRSMSATGNDGNEFTIYYIGDILPFNPNDYEIAGLVKRITFQSGELMGQTFEVNYNESAQEFEIITQFPKGGAQLPGGILTPAAGDKYVIWNITMPDEYYALASQEFLEAAIAFAESSIQDSSVYKGSLDYIDIQERGISVRPGRRVRLLSDEYFSKGYYDSRITRMTRRLWYPNEVSIDVSAVRIMGSIVRLQKSITQAETQIAQLSGQMPAIIKSGEKTSPSDSSVYTSAKSEKEFLSKTNGGRVLAPVSFEKGIAGGDDLFIYNAEKRCWIFTCNLLVEKGLAWNSSIEGFEPKTITDAVMIDSNTLGRNENGEIYVKGGAGGGGSIEYPLSWSGYSQGIWDGSSPANISIPSLLSQLTNDEGYIKGVSSDMIVVALGYTPYSSINPNGYITSSALSPYATTASVNSLLTDYLSKSGGVVSGSITVQDGIYTNMLDIDSHLPFAYLRMNSTEAAGHSFLVFRRGTEWSITDEGWYHEFPILHTANFSQYALPITGGTVNGNISATKFIGVLEGNASSASKLSSIGLLTESIDRGTIAYSRFDYPENVVGLPINDNANGVLSINTHEGLYNHQLGFSTSGFFYRKVYDRGINTSGDWKQVAFIDSTMYPTGDIAMQFPEGEYIDRYGNIVLPSTASQWSVKNGSMMLLVVRNDGEIQLNGTIHFTKDVPMIKMVENGWEQSKVMWHSWDSTEGDSLWLQIPSGVENNAYFKLCRLAPSILNTSLQVNGNLLATGEVSWNSSRVLKNIIGDVPTYMSLDDLVQIKPYRYTWKDRRDSKVHAGGIADEVMEILPEVIMTDANGIHSMDYGQAAFTMAASLTPYVNDHERRIKELEQENRELKKRLNVA